MMDYLCCSFQVSTRRFHKKKRKRNSFLFDENTQTEDSHPARKLLLCSHLFWSLCCCMLISQTDTPPPLWTGLNQPGNADNVDCLTAGRWSQVRALNQRAEANRRCDFTAATSCSSVFCGGPTKQEDCCIQSIGEVKGRTFCKSVDLYYLYNFRSWHINPESSSKSPHSFMIWVPRSFTQVATL